MRYLDRVKAEVEQRYKNEPEFLQAVNEVLESIRPVVEANEAKYEREAILERIVEPERIISFRVPWVDDKGNVQVNRGYRVQRHWSLQGWHSSAPFCKPGHSEIPRF